MTNNIPPYAEEKTINQEVEQIQETLSKFQQPMPDGFIEVETDIFLPPNLNGVNHYQKDIVLNMKENDFKLISPILLWKV